MVNGKNLEKSKLQDLDFVAYEVIKPDLKPSLQYKMLKNKKFITVINKPLKIIDQKFFWPWILSLATYLSLNISLILTPFGLLASGFLFKIIRSGTKTVLDQ